LEDELDLECNIRRCHIHNMCYLSLKQVLECKCGKHMPLDYHYKNNFLHVINGTEYVDALNAESAKIEMPTMWNVFKPVPQIIQRGCDQADCKFKQSKIYTYIENPLPFFLILNFNWSSGDLSAASLLRVFLSFNDALTVKDFFELTN